MYGRSTSDKAECKDEIEEGRRNHFQLSNGLQLMPFRPSQKDSEIRESGSATRDLPALNTRVRCHVPCSESESSLFDLFPCACHHSALTLFYLQHHDRAVGLLWKTKSLLSCVQLFFDTVAALSPLRLGY
jgi:hypothetical protein